MKEPIYLRREQPPESRERLSRRSDRHLLAVLAVTVVLWYVPYGEVILYPFAIFATCIHEICHGVVAFLLGGSFLKLIIAPDTSGYALYAGTFGSVGRPAWPPPATWEPHSLAACSCSLAAPAGRRSCWSYWAWS